jgi:hypothetical protein
LHNGRITLWPSHSSPSQSCAIGRREAAISRKEPYGIEILENWSHGSVTFAWGALGFILAGFSTGYIRLPNRIYHYPQLVPILWSIPYATTANPSIEFFSSSLKFVFWLLIFETLIYLALRSRDLFLVASVPITSSLFRSVVGHSSLEDCIDVPVALLSLLAVAILLPPRMGSRAPARIVSASFLLASGAAMTKQVGLYMIGAIPLRNGAGPAAFISTEMEIAFAFPRTIFSGRFPRTRAGANDIGFAESVPVIAGSDTGADSGKRRLCRKAMLFLPRCCPHLCQAPHPLSRHRLEEPGPHFSGSIPAHVPAKWIRFAEHIRDSVADQNHKEKWRASESRFTEQFQTLANGVGE